MIRCEINVVFIGLRVHPRRKVHAIEIPGVPPIPGHLAGLHPAEIARRGRGYLVYHVIVQEFGIVFRNDHDPPRETGRSGNPGYVVFAGCDDHLQLVVSALLDRFRIGGVHTRKRSVFCTAVEVHPGIIHEVGLRYAHLFSVRTAHHNRQECQLFGFPRRKGFIGIEVLERIEKLPFKLIARLAVTASADIRENPFGCGRKGKFGLFAEDFERLFTRVFETIGRPVVVGPEDDVVVVAEPQCQLVEIVADTRTLVDRRVERVIDAARRRTRQASVYAERRHAGGGHGYGGRSDHHVVSVQHRIFNGTVDRHLHPQTAVG